MAPWDMVEYIVYTGPAKELGVPTGMTAAESRSSRKDGVP